jgi:hypothetical protein
LYGCVYRTINILSDAVPTFLIFNKDYKGLRCSECIRVINNHRS